MKHERKYDANFVNFTVRVLSPKNFLKLWNFLCSILFFSPWQIDSVPCKDPFQSYTAEFQSRFAKSVIFIILFSGFDFGIQDNVEDFFVFLKFF